MSLFRHRRAPEPARPAAARDVKRTADAVAGSVAAATDELEAAFRRVQPLIDRLPNVVAATQRPTPGGRQ